jgi:hypothetical protein
MNTSEQLRITPKNWRSFQHYGTRNPPWIKLHRSLLTDFAYSRLPVASKALAPLLWLLASEAKDAVIEASIEEIAFRVSMTESEVIAGLKPLIDRGFFIDASGMLAECLQDARPETETETETEVEKREIVATAPRAPEKKAIEGKAGSRLPPDWHPSHEEQSFARQLGVEWQSEGEKFRDYWSAQVGAKGRKADWTATWRNWIRRAAEDRKGRAPTPSKDDRSWLVTTAPKEKVGPKRAEPDDELIEF